MRRIFPFLALLMLFSGCEKRAEIVYETVTDVLPVCAVADAPYQIEVALPGDAVEITSDVTGTLYEASNGAYSIFTRVMVSDSLDAAVYALSGFAQPQIRVDSDANSAQICQFAWCSAGEQGEMVCRAKVIRQGDYCYALCFSLKEGLGREYNGCMNDVFSSFSLIPTENCSEETEVFSQDIAQQIVVSDHIPSIIGV